MALQVPLYQSVLFDLQRQFYSAGKTNVFHSVVPSYITTNTFAASQLATQILHSWRDMADAGVFDRSQPAIVLELGSGSGRLGSLLARELFERASAARVEPTSIRYVMTEMTKEQVTKWSENPILADLSRRGILTGGVIDIGTSMLGRSIRLIDLDGGGSTVLDLSSNRNPVIVVGTYLFDSLPMDLIRVTYPNAELDRLAERTHLHRGLISVASTRPDEVISDDPSVLSRMVTSWTYAPIEGEPYAPEVWGGSERASRLNQIVDWYAQNGGKQSLEAGYALPADSPLSDAAALAEAEEQRVGQCTFTVPVGAIQALEALRAMTGPAGFLFYTIDKGLSNPACFADASEPDVHVRGSFSLMVNLHAVQLWARACGGDALVSPDDDVNVKCAAIMCVPAKGSGSASGASSGHVTMLAASDMPLLSDTFRHSVTAFGPSEFYDLQRECTAGRRAAVHPRREGRRPASGTTATEAGTDSEDEATVDCTGPSTDGDDDESDSSEGSDGSADGDADSESSGERPMFVTSDSDGSDNERKVGGGTDEGQSGPLFGVTKRRGRTVAHYADGSTAVVDGVCRRSGQLSFSSDRRHGSGMERGPARRRAHAKPSVKAPPGLLLPASHQPPLGSVRAVIALLRLSQWDPDVFVPYRDLLGRRLRYLTPPRRLQVLAGLQSMLERFFPCPGSALDVDVPYHIGRLLQTAGHHLLALRMFRASLQAVGDQPATAYSIGVSSAKLSQPAHAAHWFRRAIELAPHGAHAKARRWLQKLQL